MLRIPHSDVHNPFRMHHNAAMVVENAPDNNHTGARQKLQLERNDGCHVQKDGLASSCHVPGGGL